MSNDFVRIKALEGRVVRVAPQGAFVPTDRFVTAKRTPYVQRLIDVHGDVVEEPKQTAAPAAPAKKEA